MQTIFATAKRLGNIRRMPVSFDRRYLMVQKGPSVRATNQPLDKMDGFLCPSPSRHEAEFSCALTAEIMFKVRGQKGGPASSCSVDDTFALSRQAIP
jgi:hypothetical protein